MCRFSSYGGNVPGTDGIGRILSMMADFEKIFILKLINIFVTGIVCFPTKQMTAPSDKTAEIPPCNQRATAII
jgi:hypothetical protein